MKIKKENQKYLYSILLVAGYIFLKSSFGKIEGGKFVKSLGTTLGKFASENPHPFVKDFLNNVAIPNSILFGTLTMWGEFLVGLSLFVSAAYLIISRTVNKNAYLLLAVGCAGGMFLNGTFWFAAGWTSASTESLNFMLFVIEAAGLVYGLEKFKK